MKKKYIIGFPHTPQVHGGPGSFQMRLECQLKDMGWEIVYPENNVLPDVILVVGGTKRLMWLLKCKMKGAKIVHSLDGLNWQHRLMKTPLKEKLLASSRNLLFKFIRRYLANEVIYQSQFIKECWHKYSGKISVTEHIIYNAVDLSKFNPKIKDKPDLVCVEGTIQPHPASIQPLIKVSKYLKENNYISRVIICGLIEDSVRKELQRYEFFEIKGSVNRNDIAEILSGNLFMVLELNPPCPNSVIEALAAGCPVIGFDSGSLKDLVKINTGIISDYGTDPWKMEEPIAENLIRDIMPLVKNFTHYSMAARKSAEKNFDIINMTKKYIDVLTK